MKYIKVFNNSNNLEIYRKSKLTAPHIFLNKQNLRDIHYLEEYEELEYISSTATGGQYIDLGCHLMENTDPVEIEIKFNFKDYGKDKNSQAVLFGSNDEANSQYWPGMLLRKNNNSVQFKMKNIDFNCWVNGEQKSIAINGGNRYPPDISRHQINILNAITTNWSANSTHNKNVSLFCGLDASGNPFRYCEADLYYLKLIKGGQVIRNLVPVRRKSDNAIGLYDIENDHLYVSQGDEQFIAGSIK